jgi:hypothetical protein
LCRNYAQGGPAAYGFYRELLQRLFSYTIGASGASVVVNQSAGGPAKGVISPRGLAERSLPLRDGRFLKFEIELFLGPSDKGEAGREYLKVASESFQYQLEPDPGTDRWLFRYEYERDKDPESPHPPSHLHVNAVLPEEAESPLPRGLRGVHFPTGRLSVAAILRLIIEQFGCDTDEPPEFWRPILAAVEGQFLGFAHQTLSGPDR